MVWIDAALVSRVCGAVELNALQYDSRRAAELVGVTPASLGYGMRHGKYVVERYKGLGGRRGRAVPLVWKKGMRACDPGGGNAFEPPDAVWGEQWRWMTVGRGAVQGVRRVPVYRKDAKRVERGDERARFRGWRWVCPGCGKHVRTVFCPRRMLSVAEFLGDEKLLVKDEVDGLPGAVDCWACHACHGVRYWSGLTHSSWNHLVAYYSGGLLYGSEVERPACVKEVKRKRRYAPHRAAMVKGEEVARRLVAGESYAAIAVGMGMSINTVQGHVRRVYRKYGVHGRGELRRVKRET